MAHKKAGGQSKNLRDSQPKYLGVKLHDGQKAKAGFVLVRQRGTKMVAGKNVGVGNDHTLFALSGGTVQYRTRRYTHYTGKTSKKREVNIV